MKLSYKHLILFLALGLSACKGDDPEVVYGPGVDGSATQTESSSTSSSLTTFSVSIDRDTAEPSTVVAEEFFRETDSLDLANDPFTTVVNVSFNGSTATVDAVEGIAVTTNGAHVLVNHGTLENISYHLSGTTSQGSFTVCGERKYELVLAGTDITNPDSAAINLLNSKRAFVVLADGSQNVLRDGTNPLTDYKGTFYCKGKIIFNGNGRLDVYGNYNNAIHSADYIIFRSGNNIYAQSTANNGIKANDGIIINGGIINVEVSATAGKGINCENVIKVNGGRTTVVTTGDGEYDATEGDTDGSVAVKCDSLFLMKGGELFLKSTGKGGKALKSDTEGYITGGTVRAITEGGVYSYGNLSSSPKAIKMGTKGVGGNLTVMGGDVMVRTAGTKGEGLESKGTLTISGGSVQVYAYDDGLNSAGDMNIAGGTIVCVGRNSDGMDSNGNLYISGGNIVAYGANGAESGIDVGEHNAMYVTGGSFMSIGGRTDASVGSTTQGLATYSGSFTSGASARITDSAGSTAYAYFSMPPVSASGTALVSCPNMVSGTSYKVYMGSSSTTVTATNSISGSMGGGGGPRW